jgi:hypothetical protein
MTWRPFATPGPCPTLSGRLVRTDDNGEKDEMGEPEALDTAKLGSRLAAPAMRSPVSDSE